MVLMPGCPCCGGGGCDTTVVVTLAGLPSLYYNGPNATLYQNYAMGLGFWKASDYNGSYRLTNVGTDPGCQQQQLDPAVSTVEAYDNFIGTAGGVGDSISQTWAMRLNENISTATAPEIRFTWPGASGGNYVVITYNSATGTWPRGVVHTAGTDFTVNSSPAGFPTSGWTVKVDADTGQPAFDCTDTLLAWGKPTDADCCAAITGIVSVDAAEFFGGALPFPQYDDELELAFGTGANIRVNGVTYYTNFLTSGLTLTLKATIGWSVEYYSLRSHCPLPGWFYQGSINWERRKISDNSLFSTGTDTVCQFIIMPPTIQDMFLNTSSGTPYPTFVFNPDSANGTDVPLQNSGVHVPYAARFSTGGDDCRAWATKSIGATTLNFYSGALQASLQSPGITVTQL